MVLAEVLKHDHIPYKHIKSLIPCPAYKFTIYTLTAQTVLVQWGGGDQLSSTGKIPLS